MALGLALLARETISSLDQTIGDSGFGEQVTAIRNDLQFSLRPSLFECPGGSGRSATVVTTLNDDPGNAVQLVRVAQQLVRLEPAIMAEVMVFDPGNSQRLAVCLGTAVLWFGQQGDSAVLPGAPDSGSRQADRFILTGQ